MVLAICCDNEENETHNNKLIDNVHILFIVVPLSGAVMDQQKDALQDAFHNRMVS